MKIVLLARYYWKKYSQTLKLNLGSDLDLIENNFMNVDYYPMKSIALFTGGSVIPCLEDFIDAVQRIFSEEHVDDPRKIGQEHRRTLKLGE